MTNASNDILRRFISQFPSLTEEEARRIAEQMPVREALKGTVLLSEGAIAHECYFVLQGCVRQYRLDDGKEHTTAFFTEGQAVVPFASYMQKIPSAHSFSCVEDSVLIVGNPEQEQEMYSAFPSLVGITKAFTEQGFGAMQEEFSTFISSSPEERYLHLLRTRPYLLQRVPQHQIASYLGVTPESLSRIRKRIAEANSSSNTSAKTR